MTVTYDMEGAFQVTDTYETWKIVKVIEKANAFDEMKSVLLDYGFTDMSVAKATELLLDLIRSRKDAEAWTIQRRRDQIRTAFDVVDDNTGQLLGHLRKMSMVVDICNKAVPELPVLHVHVSPSAGVAEMVYVNDIGDDVIVYNEDELNVVFK